MTLKIQVSQPEFFSQALTHSSYSQNNNERLEFLGDALLEVFMAELLYRQFPEKKEGDLTRFRAELVRKETLAAIARELALESYIICSDGVRKSGALDKDGILSGVFEAIVAAIYLDSDFSTCKHIVSQLFSSRLELIAEKAAEKDAKSRLQEYLQKHDLTLAEYSLQGTSGKEHEQMFTIQCSIPSVKHTVIGQGTSKKNAEQNAAQAMLDYLGISGKS